MLHPVLNTKNTSVNKTEDSVSKNTGETYDK
jgi:hypothetical protein